MIDYFSLDLLEVVLELVVFFLRVWVGCNIKLKYNLKNDLIGY